MVIQNSSYKTFDTTLLYLYVYVCMYVLFLLIESEFMVVLRMKERRERESEKLRRGGPCFIANVKVSLDSSEVANATSADTYCIFTTVL